MGLWLLLVSFRDLGSGPVKLLTVQNWPHAQLLKANECFPLNCVSRLNRDLDIYPISGRNTSCISCLNYPFLQTYMNIIKIIQHVYTHTYTHRHRHQKHLSCIGYT